jgi:hypothetical protein
MTTKPPTAFKKTVPFKTWELILGFLGIVLTIIFIVIIILPSTSTHKVAKLKGRVYLRRNIPIANVRIEVSGRKTEFTSSTVYFDMESEGTQSKQFNFILKNEGHRDASYSLIIPFSSTEEITTYWHVPESPFIPVYDSTENKQDSSIAGRVSLILIVQEIVI